MLILRHGLKTRATRHWNGGLLYRPPVDETSVTEIHNDATNLYFNACIVNLVLYNLNGQKVEELVNSFKQPGKYSIDINIHDFPSGIYFYKIHMGDFQAVRKMMKIE